MSLSLLVFYGSYREARAGIRLAHYVIAQLGARGHAAELVDAKAVDLPMLDKRYFEYGEHAPAHMEALAEKLRRADGFVFVAGEYNWGMQPGLKNLVDHYGNPEWGGRPAGIVSYSAGRMAGARSSSAWHPTLSSLGMAVVPATVAVGAISASLDEAGMPTGEGGAALDRAFPAFAEALEFWAGAAKAGRG